MEVFNCIETRRITKKFQKKPVSWELLSLILDAGRLAPSAGNLQNWKFIIVLDEGKRRAVAEACLKQFWIAEAPAIIIITGEPEKAKRFYRDRADRYTIENCSAAAQNMFLEAHNLGLGSAWTVGFDDEAIRRILNMPEDAVPYIILPIGYPEESEEEAKFPIENVTYFNNWRGKIRNVPAYFHFYSPSIKKSVKAGIELAEKGLEETEKLAKEHGPKLFEKSKAIARRIREKLAKKV